MYNTQTGELSFLGNVAMP